MRQRDTIPTGYLGTWWATAGQRVSVHISCAVELAVRAYRVGAGETNAIDLGVVPARQPRARRGSFARVPASPRFVTPELTLQAWIYPTRVSKGLQGLVTHWRDGQGYGLFLGEHGDLALGVGSDGTARLIGTERRLEQNVWHFVAGSLTARGEVVLLQQPVERWPGDSGLLRQTSCDVRPADIPDCDLLLAGFHATEVDGVQVAGHFDGKTDRPRLFDRALGADELARLSDPEAGGVQWQALAGATHGRALGDAIVAAWDFGRDFSTLQIADASPHAHHGSLAQMPTRAATGFNWRGGTMDYAKAPQEYGAIHFHADARQDPGWPEALGFAPNSTSSGVASGLYAVCLDSASGRTELPLVVSRDSTAPRDGATRPDVLVWLPTFSYQAAADAAVAAGAAGLQRTPFLSPHIERRGDLRGQAGLADDLALLRWLDRERIAYDVSCDHHVHRHGVDALRGYAAVITGSQPAYASGATLDAVGSYLRQGGGLLYLGGGGFRWVTSIHAEGAGVMEVRSRQAAGERHHASTGELGGDWRARGRPPERVVGVGHVGAVAAAVPGFRRTPAGHEPEFADLFADVAAEGLLAGWPAPIAGAGPVQLDRADAAAGTPLSATLLARAGVQRSADGGPPHCADMLWLNYPGGGAVFAVGTSAWINCLTDPFGDAARITRNVLARLRV